MRQRSSSRWSRNGISPRLFAVSGTTTPTTSPPPPPAPPPPPPPPPPAEGLPSQALELVAREVGLVGAGIAGDDPRVIRARRRLVTPALREQAQLVERRRRPGRVRVVLHDLLIHRRRRVRVFRCERL